jgi:hypothetical protein
MRVRKQLSQTPSHIHNIKGDTTTPHFALTPTHGLLPPLLPLTHSDRPPSSPSSPSGSGHVVMRPPSAESEQLTCTGGALLGCVTHQP